MSASRWKARSQFFRASVGAVIVNARGQALAFERSGIPGAWQLPQGGLEAGEEPVEAVFREVFEETGIRQQELTLVRQHPDLLSYELPEEWRSEKTGRGQTQYWFLFRFNGDETRIELPENGEFSTWKWLPLAELAEMTATFRQAVYRRLAADFA
ncbi:MAG: RNA pyrophosphohydrolase [Gammaproteobacteria bacterium]|nr:MAG: RNA pyrophosphohydrolase [Gammaproteobacteria bacterium]UCH40089.1 MAG: RNA pyrophosphohydrolase [Gammaproteobacteria bacterium]